MSQTTIAFKLRVDGVLVNATSVVLSDPTGVFGARRMDTLAAVVADGTAMTRDGTGLYSHVFTDPAAGLTYNYWVEFVYGGATYRVEKNQSQPASADLSYLNVSAAGALAETLLSTSLAAWNAASTNNKQLALNQASVRVDGAMRYQGGKYAADQVREFPRWDDDRIVDQDAAGAAVVPANVLLAVLWEADSILADDRRERMSARHDGVSSQGADGMQEAYGGAVHALCWEAWQLMERYRLRGGRMG